MGKKFSILYNPISGSGKAKDIVEKLKNDLTSFGHRFQIKKSNYPGHIKELCIMAQDYSDLIIIGGDGTFHEAINGIMLNPYKDMFNISFFPGGTGNSFMHDLNATTYLKAFNILMRGKTKKIDIVKLNIENKISYSFNILGWGLVTDINILSEKLRFLGSARYTLASIYYIFKRKKRNATIIIDGVEYKREYLFIMCLNTIHTGKGMKAAPNAVLDDGLIDLILLQSDISTLDLIFLLPKIFTGEHIHSYYVKYIQAKKIEIIPEKNEILNIDGENKLKTPVLANIIPQTLSIYY
tara:strand:- start:71 stop:958 length:888 start_codon:yes stop_codon:yes gene_type:complete